MKTTQMCKSGKYYQSLVVAKARYYSNNKNRISTEKKDKYHLKKVEECLYRWLNEWNYIFRFHGRSGCVF